MQQQDDEMPDEYRRNAAKLAEFLDARENYRTTLKDLPPHLQAKMKAELLKFDQTIDELETMLVKEYDRIQAAKAEDVTVTKAADDAWETMKRIYIIIKHQTPHLLENFTKEVLDAEPEDIREEFLDGVAILEATKLDAILNGKI